MNSDSLLEKIRHRAYELWLAEGRPEGRDLEHWARAEAEFMAENGPPAEDYNEGIAETLSVAPPRASSPPPKPRRPARPRPKTPAK